MHQQKAERASRRQILLQCAAPEFKTKFKKRKPALKLEQEMLAKKWGVLEADKELDDLTVSPSSSTSTYRGSLFPTPPFKQSRC
jgi:hypothetical protein